MSAARRIFIATLIALNYCATNCSHHSRNGFSEREAFASRVLMQNFWRRLGHEVWTFEILKFKIFFESDFIIKGKIIFLRLPDFLLKQIRLGSRRWKCAKEKTRRKGQNLHHHDHHIVISTNFFREYQSEMREDKKIKFTWVESQSIKSAPAQPEKATMAIVQRWKRGEKQYARSEKLAEETSGAHSRIFKSSRVSTHSRLV